MDGYGDVWLATFRSPDPHRVMTVAETMVVRRLGRSLPKKTEVTAIWRGESMTITNVAILLGLSPSGVWQTAEVWGGRAMPNRDELVRSTLLLPHNAVVCAEHGIPQMLDPNLPATDPPALYRVRHTGRHILEVVLVDAVGYTPPPALPA